MPPKIVLDQASVTAIAQAVRQMLTEDDTVKEKLTEIVEEVVHNKLQEHFTPHGGYDVSSHLVDSMAAGMGLDGPEEPAKELAALVGDALEPHFKTITNAMNQMRTELAPGAPAAGSSGGKQRADNSVRARRQRVGNESFVVNLSETSGVDLAALEEIRSAHFGEMVKYVMSVFIFRLNNGIHMTEPLLFQWVLSFVHTNGFFGEGVWEQLRADNYKLMKKVISTAFDGNNRKTTHTLVQSISNRLFTDLNKHFYRTSCPLMYKLYPNYLVKPEHKEVLDNTFGQDDFNHNQSYNLLYAWDGRWEVYDGEDRLCAAPTKHPDARYAICPLLFDFNKETKKFSFPTTRLEEFAQLLLKDANSHSDVDLPLPTVHMLAYCLLLLERFKLERKGSGKFIAPKGASAKPKEDKQPLPGPAEIIFDKNGNIIPDKDGEYPAFYEKSAWQPMMKSILNWMSNDQFCPSTDKAILEHQTKHHYVEEASASQPEPPASKKQRKREVNGETSFASMNEMGLDEDLDFDADDQ